jgi:hypothetical protein
VSAEISQELVSAGVTQHVRMDAKWHLGGLSETLDKPMGAYGIKRAHRASHAR